MIGMPPNGYSSVNVPSGLYRRVKALIRARDELGYRSISEFAVEGARNPFFKGMTDLLEPQNSKPLENRLR